MNKTTITKFKNWILENSTLKLSESQSTDSIYLVSDDIKIRISDHIQGSTCHNIRFDISIFIPEESDKYIVSIGYKIYIYNTLQEVKSLLTSMFRLNNGIPESSISKAVNKQIDKNKEANKGLSNQIAILSKKNNKYKSRIGSLEKKASEYRKLQKVYNKKVTECQKLELRCNSLLNDNLEAKDIISELQDNPEARKVIQIKEKKYYLDNFPNDIQELLKDAISYYGT